MNLNISDIQGMEQRFRTTFINSLAGFKQAVLVGSRSAEGQTNLAIFNSLIHLGANPALFGLISRPAVEGVKRHTLQNIMDTGSYTLNFVRSEHFKEAHQTSARYADDVSEFEAVGFQKMYLKDFGAPCVQEAVVWVAMRLEELIPIALNGTTLIVGSIQQVHTNGVEVKEDGFLDLSAADVLLCQGLDAYFSARPIGRLPYAQP
jgi:flavin reductase (DIM6/NTAB) family NADH-FMN oxidoreductase RutF